MHTTILQFWFKEIEPKNWFTASAAFDKQLQERFGAVLQQAAQGEFWPWRKSPQGRLAEIIVLDQFSRNLYRGTPAAFAQDAMALALAQEAVTAGALQTLELAERNFLLMPFMHSESKRIHEMADPLFREFTSDDTQEFERKHKTIINRFGRYPHRNAVLGRASTDEETGFLKQPGSSF